MLSSILAQVIAELVIIAVIKLVTKYFATR